MSSCGRSELRIFAALTSENSDKAKLTHKAHSPGPMGYPSGSHSTFGWYYRFLMYIRLRTFDVLHKKICYIGPGLCMMLEGNFAFWDFSEVDPLHG
jgi:hypothetical protein